MAYCIPDIFSTVVCTKTGNSQGVKLAVGAFNLAAALTQLVGYTSRR